MMKEIEQFQSQNGNVTYSVKELLGALHVKIDNIDDRLNKISECNVKKKECIRDMDNNRKMFMGLFTLLLSLIGSLAYFVFYGM